MYRLEDGLLVGGRHDLWPVVFAADRIEGSTGPGKLAAPRLPVSFIPFSSRAAALADFLDCHGPADYVGFAARHGFLGLPCNTVPRDAESVAVWDDAHRVLSVAFRLWKGSTEALESLPEHGVVRVRIVLELAELRLARQKTLRFEQTFAEAGRPTDTDMLNTARLASTHLVNMILGEHAAPMALLQPGRGIAAMRIEGLTLFGSMAGELLQVMTGVRRIGECPGCGRINDLTDVPGHRVYCPGDSYVRCRKAASRSGTAPRGRKS